MSEVKIVSPDGIDRETQDVIDRVTQLVISKVVNPEKKETEDEKRSIYDNWKVDPGFIDRLTTQFHKVKRDVELDISMVNSMVFIDLEGKNTIHEFSCRLLCDGVYEQKVSKRDQTIDVNQILNKVAKFVKRSELVIIAHGDTDISKIVNNSLYARKDTDSFQTCLYANSIHIIKAIFGIKNAPLDTFTMANIYNGLLKEKVVDKQVHTASYDCRMLKRVMRFVFAVAMHCVEAPEALKYNIREFRDRGFTPDSELDVHCVCAMERVIADAKLSKRMETVKPVNVIHRSFIQEAGNQFFVKNGNDTKVHFPGCMMITKHKITTSYDWPTLKSEFGSRTWCQACSYVSGSKVPAESSLSSIALANLNAPNQTVSVIVSFC